MIDEAIGQLRSSGGMRDTKLEPLVLSEAGRRKLENWARRRKTVLEPGAAGADTRPASGSHPGSPHR